MPRRFTYYHATSWQSAVSIKEDEQILPGGSGLDGPGVYVAATREQAERRAQHGNNTVLTVRTCFPAKKIHGGAGNYVIKPENLGIITGVYWTDHEDKLAFQRGDYW
jgi:hypothetical protein